MTAIGQRPGTDHSTPPISGKSDMSDFESKNASSKQAKSTLTSVFFAFFCKYWAFAATILIVMRFAYVTARATWAARSFYLLGAVVSAVIIAIGPGLYLLSKIKDRDRNFFFDFSFIIAASLGSVMLALWTLYAVGLKTHIAVAAIIIVCFILAFSGAKRFRPSYCLSHFESIALVIALLFIEGLYECVLGTPLIAWDAIVSWDKWGADAAARSWIGGYISGAYPPGIPLVQSLFYMLFVPSGINPALSPVHLFMGGFFQIFPLLLLLSSLAVVKHLRVSPLWVLAIILGNSGLLLASVKQIGYVDIPLAAAISCAQMFFICTRGYSFITVLTILFPVAFIKGNGFVFLALAIACFWTYGSRKVRAAALAALFAAAIFYLHQWMCGVWTDLGETSPFNHSLTVVSSHKDMFCVNFQHFINSIGKLASNYSFAPYTNWPILFCMVALFSISFFNPTLIRYSIFIAVLFAIWFFHGSYDARNLIYIYPLLCVCFPLAVKKWKYVSVCIAAFLTLCIFKTRTPQFIGKNFSIYRPPVYLKLSPDELREKITGMPHEDYLSLINSDATHILTSAHVYRYLDGKGVYVFQENQYKDLRPGDIAFSRVKDYKPYTPPYPFEFLRAVPRTWHRFGENLYRIPETYTGESTVSNHAN